MKKSELKSIIKECVKEVLFEEGTLSDIIAEVAFGITKAQELLNESKIDSPPQKSHPVVDPRIEKRKISESKQRMIEAIGDKSMKNVFEGVQPLAAESSPSAHSPLSGVNPGDEGVNISGLFNVVGDRWKNLK